MYCSRCGSAIAETVTVCPVCGQPQGAGLTPMAPLVQPTGPAEVTPHWQPAPVVAYAGFWLRFVAYLLDGFIITIPLLIMIVILFLTTGAGAIFKNFPNDPDINGDAAAALGVSFFVSLIVVAFFALVGTWIYYAGCESSSWQATPGKKVLNLYVTDMRGSRVSFGRATGRFFAKFISELIPLKIGYILAGLTEQKQALHDMIASTLVLRR